MQLPPTMYCYRLMKALYGLKLSPREWYNNMNAFLLSIHFKMIYCNKGERWSSALYHTYTFNNKA